MGTYKAVNRPELNDKIYYSVNGKKKGPLTLNSTIDALSSHDLTRVLIWCEGFIDWIPASQFAENLAHKLEDSAEKVEGPPPLPRQFGDPSKVKPLFVFQRKMVQIIAVTVMLAGGFLLFSGKVPLLNGPKAVIENYLNSSTWQERLKYVRKPDFVKPLMEKHYENTKLPVAFVDIKLGNDYTSDSRFFSAKAVLARGKNAFGITVEDAVWYVLEKTENGYLIDWESSIGYNPMTITAYKAQSPVEPMKFRLKAKLADYYNYEFSGSKYRYYSIKLSENDTYQSIYGYISRDTEDGKKMYERLKDGEEHAVTVQTRFLANTRSHDIVLIESLKTFGWIEE